MEPKLAAVAGPQQGLVLPLEEARIAIGRDPANEVCLPSMWVSRQHCLIERQGSRVTITDLQSHNGTFVNGVPIKERDLSHGDQIRVGDSIFLLLLQEMEPPPSGSLVEMKELGMIAGATFELPPSTASQAGRETSPSGTRAARDLSVLLRISTAISSIREVEALQNKLLESVFEVVPAERGALLLLGADSREIVSSFGLEKSPVAGRAVKVKVSHTIVARVLRDGLAILSNDVRDNDDFGTAQSLVTADVHSVVAVPLVFAGRSLGVLYLDSSRPKVRFDQDHLELLIAVAGIASVALENARRIEWLESENRRLHQDMGLEHS